MAPEMVAAFLRHWNVGEGVPVAAMVNVAESPEQRTSEAGWAVIAGCCSCSRAA